VFWHKGSGLCPPKHELDKQGDVFVTWLSYVPEDVNRNASLAALIDYSTEKNLQIRWLNFKDLPNWKFIRLRSWPRKVLAISIPKGDSLCLS